MAKSPQSEAWCVSYRQVWVGPNSPPAKPGGSSGSHWFLWFSWWLQPAWVQPIQLSSKNDAPNFKWDHMKPKKIGFWHKT